MKETDRIEELARLYEAATPGEWVVGVSIDYAYDWPVFRLREMADSNDEAEIAADRKLIEQFHNDFPQILPVLRAAVELSEYTAWTFPAESSQQTECAFCGGSRPKHNEGCPYAALVAAVEEATRE